MSLEELQKALDEMKFWWQPRKLTVWLTDNKENWIVETLSPDNFTAFYDAFDKFSVLFSVFSAKEQALAKDNTNMHFLYEQAQSENDRLVGCCEKMEVLRKLWEERPKLKLLSEFPLNKGYDNDEVFEWLKKAEKVFDETFAKSFVVVPRAQFVSKKEFVAKITYKDTDLPKTDAALVEGLYNEIMKAGFVLVDRDPLGEPEKKVPAKDSEKARK